MMFDCQRHRTYPLGVAALIAVLSFLLFALPTSSQEYAAELQATSWCPTPVGPPASTCPPGANTLDSTSPMDSWFNGKAEVYVDQGLYSHLAPLLRANLDEKGVLAYGWSMTALQGNPAGGRDQAFQYTNLTDFGLNFDFDRLLGMRGLSGRVSGSSTSGHDLSEDVGATIPVNTVFSGNSTYFYEMYLEQAMLDETLNLRVGRITLGWEYGLDYDFFTQYLSGAYRLNMFGLENSPNFNLIPYANWGARLRWTPNEKWKLQVSFMNGYPQNFADENLHGLQFDFRPDEGALYIAEATRQWNATKRARQTSSLLPGRVTVGTYFDTGQFDVLGSVFPGGAGRQASGLGTVYGIVRQKFWEPEPVSERGIHLWSAFTHAWKEKIVQTPWYLDGGMVWFGPLVRRPEDRWALGFGNAWFNDALPDQSTETVLSTMYTWHVNDVLEVSPDLQYIIRPGGTGTIDNALLVGLLLYVTL
jgi:porin